MMKSIEQAILWETAMRGKWCIPGLFLSSLFIPMLVYSTLSSLTDAAGGLASQPEFRFLFYGFLPPILVQCAFGIVLAQGKLSRLYETPISTTRLVATHFAPGGLLLALQVALASALFNTWYQADWPVAGSALIAFTAWASAQMLIHVNHRTLGSTLILMLPILGSILWLPLRYGGRRHAGLTDSLDVSVWDVGYFALVVIPCFALTVLAVSRDRCGEKLPGVGDWSWLDRISDQILARLPFRTKDFTSPGIALHWFESCTKGRSYQLCHVLLLSILGLGWLVSLALGPSNQPIWTEFNTGLAMFGLAQCLVAACVGLLIGVLSWTSDDSRSSVASLRLGQFFATLPLSDTQMAMGTLRAIGQAIVVQWAIWIVLFWISMALVARNPLGISNPVGDLGIGWGWYVGITLLGPWIALSNMVVMSMTGRFVQLFLGSTIAVLIVILGLNIVEAVGSYQALQLARRATAVIGLLAIAGLLASLFVRVWQRNALGPTTMALTFMAACTILAGGLLFQPNGDPWIWYPCIASFTILVVLPIFAAPLALAWNRHES